MKLYVFNKETLQYQRISLKTYIYTLIIIGLFSSCIGFSTKYTTIPKEIAPFIVEKDSCYKFLTDLDYHQIKLIESNNNPKATSIEGAMGSMQIMPSGLEEWNKHHPKEQYTLEDLYISKINVKIGKWLLSHQIPYYLKHYKIPNSLNYKLIIYNYGIGNFLQWYKNGHDYSKLPEETQNYLLKYWQKY